MIRSPRKQLLRALDGLDGFAEVLGRHADAAAEVETALGVERLAAIERARQLLRDAVTRLPASPAERRPEAGGS